MSAPEQHETQEGRPSDIDPMDAREGLTQQWWLVALVPVAIAVAIILVKLLS